MQKLLKKMNKIFYFGNDFIMNKKSVSASILVMFLALVFAVIGACFSTFVYKDKMIKFDKIKVVSAIGVLFMAVILVYLNTVVRKIDIKKKVTFDE